MGFSAPGIGEGKPIFFAPIAFSLNFNAAKSIAHSGKGFGLFVQNRVLSFQSVGQKEKVVPLSDEDHSPVPGCRKRKIVHSSARQQVIAFFALETPGQSENS